MICTVTKIGRRVLPKTEKYIIMNWFKKSQYDLIYYWGLPAWG